MLILKATFILDTFKNNIFILSNTCYKFPLLKETIIIIFWGKTNCFQYSFVTDDSFFFIINNTKYLSYIISHFVFSNLFWLSLSSSTIWASETNLLVLFSSREDVLKSPLKYIPRQLTFFILWSYSPIFVIIICDLYSVDTLMILLT